MSLPAKLKGVELYSSREPSQQNLCQQPANQDPHASNLSANQRLTRWAVFLQQFKFDIQHRPGSQHKNADGLSRGGRDVTKQTKAVPNSPDNHADFIENT